MSKPKAAAGIWLLAATTLAVTGIGLVFIMVIAFALPVFATAGAEDISLFSWRWSPTQGQFGILPMIAGSLLLALSALALAWILALGLCCWLLSAESPTSARAHRLLRRLVAGLIRFMTAIPTVVYGFVAIFLLVPLIRAGMGGGSGLSWLAASLVLSLLLLPTLVLVMEAGLRPRFDKVHLSASALGFSRAQTLLYFVLPHARRSLLTALLLGFGRATGDTLIALMLAGNAPQLPLAMSDGLRTLTAHMALVTANEVGGMAYNSLFAAGAILLLINGSVSLTLRYLGRERIS